MGILSGLTKLEKILFIILCICIFLPLILSLITFAFPEWFVEYPFINHITYLIFWIPTFILTISFFTMLLFFTKRGKIDERRKYSKIKWSVKKTLLDIIRKRKKSKIGILFSLIVIVLFLFFSVMSSGYFIIKQTIIYNQGDLDQNDLNQSFFNQTVLNSNSGAIFLISISILTLSILWFFGLFAGFQDSLKKKSFIALLFVFPFWFPTLLIGYSYFFKFESFNKPIESIFIEFFSENFLPTLGLIIGILAVWFGYKKLYHELNKIYSLGMKRKKWHTLFSVDFFVLCFPLFGVIIIYMFLMSILIMISAVSLLSFQLFLIFTLIIGIPIIISSIFLAKILSEIILEILFYWNKFMKVYNGKYTKDLNKTNSLVKVSGRCIAICFDEYLKKHYPYFQQQFMIQNKDFKDKKPVEVIYLKELSPFLKSKYIVREGEKIKIFGEIRHNWKKDKPSPIIIAYHIESIR